MGLPSISYRADIDGLRAVAVLLVLFNHAKLGFRGGYVGVDVFFVISGYLITGIMVKELEEGRFSILSFWERRIRRIWPAMTVVVLAVLVAGYLCMLPYDLAKLGRSALMQAALVANIYFWGDSGYFDTASNEKPLLHNWSLAVEEQFYLVLPFLLIGLYGWLRSKGGGLRAVETRIFKALAVIGVVSFVLGSAWVFFDANTAFYWLPHRAWELLIGGCLACIPREWYPKTLKWASWAGWGGLVAILVTGLAYRGSTPFPGLAALPPCLGAAAIIWANLGASKITGAGKLLAWKPMVTIGLISYSLYLWHWPLLAYARYLTADAGESLSALTRWGIVIASILLAFASLHLVETPVRRKLVFKSRKAIFIFGAVSTLLCAVLAWGLMRTEGMPGRIPVKATQFAAAKFDKPSDWASTWVTVDDAQKGRFKIMGKARSDQPPTVMLWGDSHARCTMPAIEDWCMRNGVYGEATVYNTISPTLGYYRQAKNGLNEGALALGEAVLERVRSQRIKHTVLTGFWNKCAQGNPPAFREALKKTVQAFQAAGSQVTIILDVPTQSFDVPKALALAEWRSSFPDPRQKALSLEGHRKLNKVMYDLVPELEKMGVWVLDPIQYLSGADGLSLIDSDGWSVYFDSNHLSHKGALKIAPLLQPLFQP